MVVEEQPKPSSEAVSSVGITIKCGYYCWSELQYNTYTTIHILEDNNTETFYIPEDLNMYYF